MIGDQKNNDRTIGAGTKLDPAMAEVLNACCDALGVDTYHLLQWFAYTIIRAAAPMHALDPRIQKLMTMMESDAGWQKAFNLANPNNLRVAQVVLILEQENRKGFGAVMIDKPYFGDTQQTECVDNILERITEVCMQGIYRRLREIGRSMECESLSDVLLTMIDAQAKIEAEDEFMAEMPGIGDHADNGRQVVYGKKSKAKQHRTPDSLATDQRIRFNDFDRTDNADTKEWEGEHRQSDLQQPEGMPRPFGEEW